MLNKTFNVKQEGDKKILELYLYGDIQDDYIDWWTWEKVESTTSAKYIKKAIDEAGNISEIIVYINSCGGSVMEGVAIYNILKRHSAFVTVCIDAFAYSVASVIAMAGDKVVMPSNTTMFIHNAWIATSGNSSQLRKTADDLDTINESTKSSYLAKAGEKLSKELLDELMDKETFLTADDAFKYGLCDEIANPIENTNDSKEIAEQALKNPNFNDSSKRAIKQAYENMTTQRKSPPAPPANQKAAESKEPKKDFYERLKDSFNNKF
ncbi:MAG: head maturation protease, ClpP-related [Ruminococcus sp.]|nr:head maturation protease, ClpP-related [Ruminococcus sp.]